MAQWEGARGWPSWSFSNHDVTRFPTRLAADDPQRTKLMLALLLALRGAIFLYQGDELGLQHADVPFDRLRDPEAIAFWPSGIGRDGARTPMPWNRNANMAGFTDAPDAWLPLDPRHVERAVDAQEADANSVLAFARQMIALRKSSTALREGEFIALDAPDSLLVFERRTDDARVLCMFNLDAAPVIRPLPPGAVVKLVVGEVQEGTGSVTLGGFSGLLAAL